MVRNKPIRKSTDTIGFLLIITEIPVNIDNKEIIAKKLECKLLDIISFNKYKLFISKKNNLF
jgi:hypothetical protein